MIWVPVITMIVGLLTLVWSADKFLSGAAAVANNFGIPKMLIGLTIVSIGTSAPEIFVAIAASLEGTPLIAVGNAIGSNIANIGLVLAITAIIAPLPFSKAVLIKELPWLLGVTLLSLVLMFDLTLSIVDSFIMLAVLGMLVLRLVRDKEGTAGTLTSSVADELEEISPVSTPRATTWLIIGLVILLASAEVLVWAASTIADQLGVDDIIIGLTIVAIGTSLPELAATVGAAIKGHTDIAIGNVVGSNILNILAVLSVPGLFSTTYLENVSFWRDCGMMLALTIMLGLFGYARNSRPVITRFEGVVMLTSWIGYNILIVQQI
tara:strand:- start:227 stop:1192 length:966 start_codon:yes stop_codon:yes gene_type:complete